MDGRCISKMEYSIRPYNEKIDYDFVWNLHLKENRAYAERHIKGITFETLQDWFNQYIPKYNGHIVEHARERIGCYFVRELEDRILFRTFFLVEKMQNKGLGSKLFSKILEDYKDTGKFFEITVWPDNPVQEFWYKKGFIYNRTIDDNLLVLHYTPAEYKK